MTRPRHLELFCCGGGTAVGYDRAREDFAPAVFAALWRVLELHKPVDRGTGPQCAGCGTHVTFTPYPCRAVQAVTEELSRG